MVFLESFWSIHLGVGMILMRLFLVFKVSKTWIVLKDRLENQTIHRTEKLVQGKLGAICTAKGTSQPTKIILKQSQF